ncbi:hypothetical protein [Mycobacterium sp. HNNTM2301]|uniref:hypothetical protein n=1 Tax=Mycobacterium hainanense TaxID=3289775 RepID=UPI0035A71C39
MDSTATKHHSVEAPAAAGAVEVLAVAGVSVVVAQAASRSPRAPTVIAGDVVDI